MVDRRRRRGGRNSGCPSHEWWSPVVGGACVTVVACVCFLSSRFKENRWLNPNKGCGKIENWKKQFRGLEQGSLNHYLIFLNF